MVEADVELLVLELDEAMFGTNALELNNLPSLNLMKPWLELMWSSQFLVCHEAIAGTIVL
jgi:hypothetical protein